MESREMMNKTNTILPLDPLAEGGIREFGERLRRGEITSEEVTKAYLGRIKALEPALGAYEYVAADQALAQARSLDRLLAAGTDLGPLMGVPVAVKDLLAVDGMPSTAGSNVDVSDLIGSEGRFVKTLKRAGGVILGKTKTVEFALGGAGTNRVRGTPRNPWDANVFRVPGGSSSGSAVAMASGMCGFAIGSDTGGSVRGPAAFCGVFGLKTTAGLWPTDGVYPLSPTLDTLGLLTATADDAAIAYAALEGVPAPAPRAPRGLRLGRPTNHFFDNLDPEVEKATAKALAALETAGAEIVPIEVPEVTEADDLFYDLIAAEFIAVIGRQRFVDNRERMDRDVANWGGTGLDIPADHYIRILWRHRELCRSTRERFRDFDGWVNPTRPIVARPQEDYDDADEYSRLARRMAQNTRHGNAAGLCAASIPVQSGGSLPVGLQVACAPMAEGRLLSIARLIESLVGAPPRPDVAPFLAKET